MLSKKFAAAFLHGFFSKDPATNLAIMMGDWMAMAEVVGRKLVESGQERILQRIFDGVNSNFVLDISDFKESQEHKLLHLVWRKFPRNRPPTDGQRTITTHSTQTEGVSAAGLNKISKSSIISDTDCFPASGLKGLFDANESAPISDAGWTFDSSFSSADLVAQEGESFKLPAKGRASKPKIFESKSQTELVNRSKCLEEYTPENDDTFEKTGRKSPVPSPRIFFGGNRSRGTDSRQITTKTTLGSESSSVSPKSGKVTQSMKDAEGNRREEGTVIMADPIRTSANTGLVFGSIAPDTFSPVREPVSLLFKSYLQSDFGIKKGDRVSYFYQLA
ncbi:MAG: hypothetical protein GY696_07680, partial [Gammaproteobacteria bacterium]|nr:hypothetical protein [Gammaproteobacteria bacterium]